MACLLIVEDEAKQASLLAQFLTAKGFTVLTAATGEQALALVATQPVQLVLLDLHLERSRLSGLEVLDQLRAQQPTLPVLVLSGSIEEEQKTKALARGAKQFLEKPILLPTLLPTLLAAIHAVLPTPLHE